MSSAASPCPIDKGMDRRQATRRISDLRRKLDKDLMMAAILGVPADIASLDRLSDEIHALARAHPEISLADVEAERRRR